MISGELNYPVECLQPHTRHKTVYDSHEAYPGLIDSIRKNGMLEPLVLCGYQVLIGCRRLDAAKKLKMTSVPARKFEPDPTHSWEFTMWNDTPRVKPEWVDDAGIIMSMISSNLDRQKTSQERNREIGWRFMIEYCFKEQERRRRASSFQAQLAELVRILRHNAMMLGIFHSPGFSKLLDKHGEDHAFAHLVKTGLLKELPPKSARIVYDY